MAAAHADTRSSRWSAWPRWNWCLSGLVVLLIVAFALQVVLVGRPAQGMAAFGMSSLLLNIVGLVVSARAAVSRRLAAADRRPWRYVTVAWVLSLSTNIAFAAFGTPATSDGAMSWVGVVSRLLMVPALLAGVLSFPTRRLCPAERYKFALDMTTVVGGGFMVMWYFILGPALAAGGPAGTVLALAGFPLGDLLLIFGVCAVLLRGGVSSARHPLSLLVLGLTAFLAADVYFSYEQIQQHGSAVATLSPLIRVCLLTSAALMAAAAVQQLRHDRYGHQPVPAQHIPAAGVSQLPYLALCAGYLLLLVAAIQEDALFPWGGLVTGAIVMTGSVALRQFIAMRENHRLVVTDSLTGLANRLRLRTCLQQLSDRREPIAVLLIDLDGFKQVNDTLGHEAGDQMLVAFADLLGRVVRQSDTAGRLGGDEFALVLPGVTDAGQAAAVAERVLAAAATPVRVGESKLRIRASIGVALSQPDDTPHALLHRADTAMYAAKRSRGPGWAIYHRNMESSRANDAELSAELESAAEAGQLRVLYQPIVTLADGELTAVEALVRWQHPTRGLLTPDVFIPLAEQTGAIHAIGMWVLEQTCRQVHHWQQTLPAGRPLYASVNLSPHQLHQTALVEDVLGVLERTGLDPRDLVLELTESALVNEQSGIAALSALREHGIRIAVDDFGTGYSSLRYLTRLPVDILKLDRCFVAELNGRPEGSAVAEAVIRLSQILHLDTVAEGVEELDQATELTLLGCRTGQGYLFARPMAAEALQLLIQQPAPTQ